MIDKRLLDRLDNKLEKMLLDSDPEILLEMLRERLLEMTLGQLIVHEFSVAEDVGVIFGVTTDRAGYAQEQIEDI